MFHNSRARSISSSSQRPNFQKKYKERANNGSVVIDSTSSVFIPNANNQQDQIKSTKSKGSHSQNKYAVLKPKYQRQNESKQKQRSNSVILSSNKWCALDSDDFHNTTNQLSQFNFKHHDSDKCVCDLCTCGRHLCKLHAISPNLTKASNYQRQFTPKKGIPNKINIAKQYGKLDGPHLLMNSTYLKDYPDKTNDDLSRPKPEDLLKTGGPCPNLTSYSSNFPGYRGDNQYVKPTDKHTRGYFPLKDGTTYSNNFQGKPKKKDDWDGIPNNLKTGTGWLGDSTYNQNFKAPKQSAYPKHVKFDQKLEINPDNPRQYETSYRNDFIPKGNGICPAKIQLQTRLKGKHRNSKINFEEKMDFKAVSPQFQAISTSKFSYV